MPLFINEAYVNIYADDSTLNTASKKLETVEEALQKGSPGFKAWCLSNGMYINIGTCKTSYDNRSNMKPFNEIHKDLCEQSNAIYIDNHGSFIMDADAISLWRWVVNVDV